ncbi:MAG: hypothetical protein A2268_03565 [Candidatus Raymondbacteria bacterium RifOxyA12_full_50_37]|uniref:4Fe-4S ferredoxin-type domain-containing protein n=1 Tax=Candidatus Raymondbacteria bacterium RIFOXYD12_FULL_49_13 TaxID=1817890 RepID=A0A1F7F520_UNCRA|nr:MAG: hypothetical protein A2268_03565 [Candidatus Raymondbacteria bacterium RifOxyA12_full_50_37]OGJ91872.1 MAG: hypothetical protein A2248_04635 [Candidatus Raymondbacteria bacterium RIFOXYA2_FULL_49_16]OGJ98090.1 MAG: hypothetical protein A2453_12380 [Candidatus Raymondbacteria bacterium RIFOXYC2_FULL_50_21]OGK01678.1 MAG: hypothetical protein A2519_09110 [Candidatus Raymondbacteria bacterium RIFOXYD12_FULL_49_13]OGK02325.1 MAG: hypothetical protein A2350_03050 [Candidatus Raymondbacteria 
MKKKTRYSVRIIAERCKGCMFCVSFCPAGVLGRDGTANARGYPLPCIASAAVCTGCALCQKLCPDFAIFIESNHVR